MVSFRQFLEGAVSDQPKYEPQDVKKAFRMAIENCKDAEHLIRNNRPLWRAMQDDFPEDGVAVVDTSATERRSENTSNYYTMILDNNPFCKDFPKRSRSFICSTSKRRAQNFYGELYAILPFDGVKFGLVNDRDLWDTSISLFGRVRSIDAMNNMFEQWVNPTLESFVRFDKMLKQEDSNADKTAFEDYFSKTNISMAKVKLYEKAFLELVWEAYSPKRTGFTVSTTKNFEPPTDSEVWVSGKCMVFSEERWDEFLRLAKDGNI